MTGNSHSCCLHTDIINLNIMLIIYSMITHPFKLYLVVIYRPLGSFVYELQGRAVI